MLPYCHFSFVFDCLFYVNGEYKGIYKLLIAVKAEVPPNFDSRFMQKQMRIFINS